MLVTDHTSSSLVQILLSHYILCPYLAMELDHGPNANKAGLKMLFLLSCVHLVDL